MNAVPASAPQVHWPCLALAVLLMVAGTLYPPLMTDRAGRADHVLAGLFLWATSAGFVRGVGFVPASRPLALAAIWLGVRAFNIRVPDRQTRRLTAHVFPDAARRQHW